MNEATTTEAATLEVKAPKANKPVTKSAAAKKPAVKKVAHVVEPVRRRSPEVGPDVLASGAASKSKGKKNVVSRPTYDQIMTTRTSSGDLRKPHLATLKALSAFKNPQPFAKVVEKAGIVARGVSPSLKFLEAEKLVETPLDPDEVHAKLFKLTVAGTKELEKAAK